MYHYTECKLLEAAAEAEEVEDIRLKPQLLEVGPLYKLNPA